MALKNKAIRCKEFEINNIKISINDDETIDILQPYNKVWKTLKKQEICTILAFKDSYFNISKNKWLEMLNTKID